MVSLCGEAHGYLSAINESIKGQSFSEIIWDFCFIKSALKYVVSAI